MKTQKPDNQTPKGKRQDKSKPKTAEFSKKGAFKKEDKPPRKFSKDKTSDEKDKKTFKTEKAKPFRDNKAEYKERKPFSSKTVGKNTSKSPDTSEGVRLNKYIANAGICSRRDADILIQSGNVMVNDVIITEMGTKVLPGDKVSYDGKQLKNEKKVYLLLNKPKDYITTSDDPQKRRTVLTLISGACKERIYPVGRLDRMTTGVLLFTNDGDLAKKLTHPKHGVRKIYHVVLDKNLVKTDMIKIIEGVELEDGVVDVDKISYAGDGADKKEIGLEIHSGRNRIVRRLFEALGYAIVKLDRVSFAGLTKKNIQRGEWRFLSTKEVSFLQMLK